MNNKAIEDKQAEAEWWHNRSCPTRQQMEMLEEGDTSEIKIGSDMIKTYQSTENLGIPT